MAAGGAVGQEAARVRKRAALRGGLCADAVRMCPTARLAMAVPGTFLAPILLLLCGLGPRLAAAHSPPGKRAHGPQGGREATVPQGWWGWGMSLPSDGGRGGQDVGLCGPVSRWGMRQRPRNPPVRPGTPGTYMAPCSEAAGRAGLCQGATLGVLAPTLALEHRWHHRPHGYRPCSSPGPTAPGPMALLAPQPPAPQLCWLWGCQPCRQRCREGPWPWGSPVAGQGGGQRQDAMRRSYRPCASAGQGSSWRICTSRPFHPGHVSGAAHRQGTGDGGQRLLFPPSTLAPAVIFQEKITFLSGCQ